MPKETTSGIPLIIGSLLSMLLMAFHPNGRDLAENISRGGHLNILVHSTAIAAIPMILLGMLGLRRRLGASDASNAAMLSYALASMAWTCAAVASGFVQTDLYIQMHLAQGETLDSLKLLSMYTHLVNQGFAKVGVVASSVAIGLWARALWRPGANARGLGIAGAALAIATLLALLSGHVSLGVHGFGLIIVGQSLWFIWAGVWLLRNSVHSNTKA